MDQRTRKLMIMHPSDDVDRQYVLRKMLQHWRQHWRIDTTRRLHWKEQRKTRNKNDNTRRNRTEITRKQNDKEKQLYGRLTSDISHEKTWTWLKKRNLKRVTQSLLIAAQNNAQRTNNIKARIDKTQQNSECRLCGDRDETIYHIRRKLITK